MVWGTQPGRRQHEARMFPHWVLAQTPKPLKSLFHPTHHSRTLTVLPDPQSSKTRVGRGALQQRIRLRKSARQFCTCMYCTETHEGMPLPISASQRVTDLVSQPQHKDGLALELEYRISGQHVLGASDYSVFVRAYPVHAEDMPVRNEPAGQHDIAAGPFHNRMTPTI